MSDEIKSNIKRILDAARIYMAARGMTNTDDLTEADIDAIYAAAGVERVRAING